ASMASCLGEVFARTLLAHDVVRFVGEAVAVVVAETRAQAMDAAEAVVVSYDPLPVVADPSRAMEPNAVLIFPDHGSNVVRDSAEAPLLEDEEVGESRGEGAMAGGDLATASGSALEGAEVVVRGRFVNQRLAPVPMEVNSGLAEYDTDVDTITLWLPSQAPFFVLEDAVTVLGLEPDRLRVIAPDVGGGFGAKGDTYPEHLVLIALAMRFRRAVRY